MLVLGVILILATMPGVADAHDHRSPKRAVLWAGGQTQVGLLRSVTWSSPSEADECVTESGDGTGRFPPGLQVPAGEVPAAIRVRKRDRPDRLAVEAWREVDQNGLAAGPVENLPFDLDRVRRHGRTVAWIAHILPTVTEDTYILFFARWRDRDGCGGRQSKSWSFHLNATSAP